jgi:hypothetical protein
MMIFNKCEVYVKGGNSQLQEIVRWLGLGEGRREDKRELAGI